MSADPGTMAAYQVQAAAYAARFDEARPSAYLQAFMAGLPPAARVLDLGCGPATASAFLRAAGHVPDPVDASAAMVELANGRHAIGARQASFDDLAAVAAYDGVWANFSLLHAPRAAFPGHLAAIRRALRPSGLFHIGAKTGTGEARDRFGRFYCYYGRDELLGLLQAAGLAPGAIWEGHEVGLAGTRDPYIVVHARG